MSEFDNTGSLGIEDKQDHPQRVKDLAGTETKYFFSAAELDKMRRATEELFKTKASKDELVASANGFILFADEAAADAEFTANPPAKDVLFRYTDPGASKADFYRRASDNTTQLLREASLTEAEKSETGPSANDEKLPTNTQVKSFVEGKFVKETVYSTDQLFDAETMLLEDTLVASTGVVLEGNDAGYVTAKIPVDDSQSNITISGQKTENGGVYRNVFKDANDNIVGSVFGNNGDGTDSQVFTKAIPAGAAFLYRVLVRDTQQPIASNHYEGLMINYGNTASPYEPYDAEELVVQVDGEKLYDQRARQVAKEAKNTAEKAIKVIDINWIEGSFYNEDKTLTANSSSVYAEITDVEPNSAYSFFSNFTGGARKILLLDEAENVLKVFSGGDSNPDGETLFIETNNAVKIALSTSTIGGVTPVFTLYKVVPYEFKGASTGENIDLDDYLIPEKVLGIDNDSSAFFVDENVQTLMLEGVVPERVEGLTFNGQRSLALQRLRDKSVFDDASYDVSGSTVTEAINSKLKAPGYNDVDFEIDLIKTRASVAQSENIRYAPIGDSTTAKELRDFDGTFNGQWNYPSALQKHALKFNEDLGDISVLNIGTTNYKSGVTFDYNGSTIPVRSFSEGRGGWCAFTYLRHAINVRVSGSQEVGSSNYMTAEEGWDSLGLGTLGGTQSYEAYTGTTAQNLLITNTAHNLYNWEYTETLWLFLKNRYPSLVTWGASYSSGENSKIDTAMNALLDDPVNPFFDKTVGADDSNDYAFNYQTYLNRYKTLEDDGITRLVVGTTAGTKVTDVNAYDVCTPTHATIALGTNDIYTERTAAQIDSDIARLAILVRNVTNAKVATFITRQFGSFYPERWQDIGITKVMTDSGTFAPKKWELNKLMQSRFPLANLGPTDNYAYLPCFFLQGVLDASSSQLETDILTGRKLIIPVDESSHPGIYSMQAVAYQILSWIFYTLS